MQAFPFFTLFKKQSCSAISLIVFSIFSLQVNADENNAYQLVPLPNQLSYSEGELSLSNGFELIATNNEATFEQQYLIESLSKDFQNNHLVISKPNPREDNARVPLFLQSSSIQGANKESYAIRVEETGVHIEANTAQGIFLAAQTFRQMLRGNDGKLRSSLPFVHIEDSPRFPYRGMHLDVGRHYFSTEFIKKYIDLLAMYKLNYFHWHLTEDQGWRIEIKKYSRLTSVGAYRKESQYHGKGFSKPYTVPGTYGNFYTQEEIRDIVAYAQARHITIVPEIDLPGHSTAALAAYPEYGCIDKTYEVATSLGIKYDLFCPSEETFAFLGDVLNEVIDLFPGEYIHIGGDEAPKKQWEESELAQAVMKREKLKSEQELQSYFMQRLGKIVKQRNRKLVGWDEILQGGLAPDATVMSWRGMGGGIKAAQSGNEVIMTPIQYTYFDLYQGAMASEPNALGGYVPLEKTYHFNPIPSELNNEQAKLIKGVQGNLWTEFMSTPEQVEYMALPRMFALAEVAWTQQEKREWQSFKKRLPNQFELIAQHHYKARTQTLKELDDLEFGFWQQTKINLLFAYHYLPALYQELRYGDLPFYLGE